MVRVLTAILYRAGRPIRAKRRAAHFGNGNLPRHHHNDRKSCGGHDRNSKSLRNVHCLFPQTVLTNHLLIWRIKHHGNRSWLRCRRHYTAIHAILRSHDHFGRNREIAIRFWRQNARRRSLYLEINSMLQPKRTSLKNGCLNASAAVIRFFGLIINSLRSKSNASLSDSIPLT